MSGNALQKRWHLAGARRKKEFIEKERHSRKKNRHMKIVRSIQGIVSLVQLKSESIERERNLDFMLNDNPRWGLKVRRWGAQKEAQFKESYNGD